MSKTDFGFAVRIPNQPFKQPENAVYGEFHIMGGTEPIPVGGMGAGKIVERNVRMIQLTVWIPEGKGTAAGAKALDKFNDLFAWKLGRDREGNTYKFRGLQTFNPTVKAGWECMIGRVPFTRDETTLVDVGVSVL